MHRRIACLAALCLLAFPSLFADFHYTETSQITGGSMMSMMKMSEAFSKQAKQAGEPRISSVYVKGNRMARIGQESSEIVDLDQETVTHIDNIKRQYYTITFQQMKERLEEAQREMAQQPQPKTDEHAPTTEPPQINFNVTVRNTGATSRHSGLETSESILALTMQATGQQSGQSGTMAITNDLWMAPEIPGYAELRDFNRRYARKLGDLYGSATAPMLGAMRSQMRPGSGQGLSEMAREVSKLRGFPIYTVMRMGSTADGSPLPAASEAPLPPGSGQSAEMPSKDEMAKQGASDAATSAMASRLGGLGGMMGGFGHRKKKDAPPPPSATSDAPPPTTTVLMESTTEMGDFSTAPIDGSIFQPPPGYQQIGIPDYRHMH